jgi:hypothetical protein
MDGREINPARATKRLRAQANAENLRIGVDEALTPSHSPAGFRFRAMHTRIAAAG